MNVQLGLSGPYGLSSEELQDLWAEADIDSNGVLDFNEFQV
jgi:Ca2+-binding EF-hand superfamily protein